MRTIISLSLPAPLARDLSRLAKRLRVPRSALVRQAVERHVLSAKFEDLFERFQRRAAEAGIVSEEQVFERFS